MQLGASRKPLHSLKSSAPAKRSSIIARCFPIQDREPIMKVENAALTSGVGFSKRVSSNLETKRQRASTGEGNSRMTYSLPLGKISGMRWTTYATVQTTDPPGM